NQRVHSGDPQDGFKRGCWRHDVSHHHTHQGGPGEVQGPESDCADRQRLRQRQRQGCM
uniref:Uncharacterized protein n=1 Tax=Moschus moschiferus TaxID=68415 RepID=A0A8C6FVU5_MOSMO